MKNSVDLPASLQRTTPEAADPRRAEIRKAAEQFEGLFIHQLLQTMRSSAKLDDEDFGVSMSNDMFDDQLSRSLGGKLGIAEILERELGGDSRGQNRIDGAFGEAGQLRKSQVHTRSYANAEAGRAGEPAGDKSTTGILGEVIFDGPIQPVDGAISSEYGARAHPMTGDASFHEGIDIAAREGDDIRVVADGKVVRAGVMGSYGKVVDVQHADGTITRYAHASQLYVRRGDHVERGETIAAVGNTGSSTAAHLHFEVMQGERAIDPSAYLRRRAAQGYGSDK